MQGQKVKKGLESITKRLPKDDRNFLRERNLQEALLQKQKTEEKAYFIDKRLRVKKHERVEAY